METLRRFILNEVRKVVNEEMGISEEVTAEVEHIINILNEYLADPNNYKYFDWNEDGRSRVYGVEDEFPVFVFGDKLIYLVFRAVICNSSRGLIGLKDVERYYFVPDSTTRLNLSFPIIRRDFKKGDTVQIGLRGTRIANTIAHELAELEATTIIGGGDSAAAVQKAQEDYAKLKSSLSKSFLIEIFEFKPYFHPSWVTERAR